MRTEMTPAKHRAHYLSLSDDALAREVAQAEANATSREIDGMRPQFYGMPRAAADSAIRLKYARREQKRRVRLGVMKDHNTPVSGSTTQGFKVKEVSN